MFHNLGQRCAEQLFFTFTTMKLLKGICLVYATCCFRKMKCRTLLQGLRQQFVVPHFSTFIVTGYLRKKSFDSGSIFANESNTSDFEYAMGFR